MIDLYGRTPVNKTAATVTSQKDCAADDQLTSEQVRENLVSKVKLLKEQIQKLKKGSAERKKLGVEISEIEKEINSIRPSKKAKQKVKTVADMALDILREEMTEYQFKNLISRASKRLDELDEAL